MTAVFCLHMAATTLTAYLLALATGSLSAWVAAASLVFGAGLALAARDGFSEGHGRPRLASFSPGAGRWIETALGVCVAYAAYRHFGWMLFYAGDELKTLHANNFGDLPLHLNYIRFLANGAEFPPWNPIYALEKLRYPIGLDLYSALWEKIGVPTESHFFWVGALATLASFTALRAWAGWWGIGGFFFGGGWLAWKALLAPGAEALDGVAWKNLFLSVWITQRGLLYALPAGLWLLTTARRAFCAEISLSRRQWDAFGLIWGSMALFHLHSFFAVSVILAGLAFICRGWKEGVPSLRAPLRAAFPVGAAFVFYLTDGFARAGVAHWRPGWMAGDEGMIRFLVVNFRFWILPAALLPAIVLATERAPGHARALLREYGFHLALFVLFMNLMLAPWEWDNIKILLWPYLGLLFVAREAFSAAFARARWGGAAEVALATALLAPGICVVAHSTMGNSSAIRIGELTDISSAQGALIRVPRSALLLAAPTHDHPVALLGYRRALGYQGHLWSHGIDSSLVTADVERVMRGRGEWRSAARALGATHIVWGPQERSLYGAPPEAWKTALPNLSPVAGYEVYEIR